MFFLLDWILESSYDNWIFLHLFQMDSCEIFSYDHLKTFELIKAIHEDL